MGPVDEAVGLLCFGGPMNEQIVAIERVRYSLVAAKLNNPASWLNEPNPDPTAPVDYRTITYQVRKVGYHDLSKHALGPMHPCSDTTEGCRWSARCLVAEGYPMHRITDTLNAIAGMSRLLSAGKTRRLPWWRVVLLRVRRTLNIHHLRQRGRYSAHS